jgi:hypothetical protein
VKERSAAAEFSTVSMRTSGGCVRGSGEELAPHAARMKGSPMAARKETARRGSMETSG